MLVLSEAAILSGSLKYASFQGDTVNVPGIAHVFIFLIVVMLVEGIH